MSTGCRYLPTFLHNDWYCTTLSVAFKDCDWLEKRLVNLLHLMKKLGLDIHKTVEK